MSIQVDYGQKFRLVKEFTGTGVIGNTFHDVILSKQLGVVVENVGGGNTVLVKGRIQGQTAFTTIATITGASAGTEVDTSLYDQVQFECTVYSASGGTPKLVASGFFNQASGSVTAPGGADTNVQYNDGGVFGGDANFTWNKTTKLLTITQTNLISTPTPAMNLKNSTAATALVQVQSSPSLTWEGQGWKTAATAASQSVLFRAYVRPIPGSTVPRGQWELSSNINSGGWSNIATVQTGTATNLTTPNTTWTGSWNQSVTNSNSTVGLLDHFRLENPSGTHSHLSFSFSNNFKAAMSSTNNGTVTYRAGGSAPIHNFEVGSSITTTALILQIYGAGTYTSGSAFHTGNVTAGSGTTTPKATFSDFGSMAVKGTTITSNTATLDSTHHFVYADPTNANICSGTPSVTACSTYVSEGTCVAHSGCTWSSGTNCNAYNGTDETTCETGHAGCTWETASCSTFTDQSSCEAQSPCTWDQTGDCTAFMSQGACEANAGCTWSFTNCSDSFFDESSCNAQAGCSWNGSSCDGVYNENCSGNFYQCNGTYDTGVCSGTWGAGCSGTVTCGGYVTSGTCTAEAGCSWITGQTLTLPTTTACNLSNTSRWHSIVNVGAGPVTINANTGDTIYQYSNIVLSRPGDSVMLHNHIKTGNCSVYNSDQSGCQSTSGCSWTPAVVCSDYNGDESGCLAAGCSYSDPNCTGAGSASSCSGTYTVANYWYVHYLEQGEGYVEKTANYTLTNIDDVVNCTSGTFALTLPSAVTYPYKKYSVINSGSGVITMNTTSSQTINGLASGVMTLSPGESGVFYSTATNWVTL